MIIILWQTLITENASNSESESFASSSISTARSTKRTLPNKGKF